MTTTPHTPDTDSVRMHYTTGAMRMNPGLTQAEADAEFDRFLTQSTQEASEAEVDAAAEAICSGEGGCDPCFGWDDSVAGGCTYCTRHARAALTAAEAIRRNEQKR